MSESRTKENGHDMTADPLERRFGIVALEKGFVSPEQLREALEIQVTENIEKKKHRFIGTILVDQGYMKHSQISEVLKALK
jgi:starvation-inducible outer membrane lipoprotein